MALRTGGLVLLLLGLAGCGPQDPIRHYQVAKPEAKHRQLATVVPEGWLPGQLVISRGGIQVRRDAAFEVRDGDKRVEVTVTSLPAEANSALSNVNRWRQQIQLEPSTEDQFRRDATKIQVGDLTADYVQLSGPRETTLGVIAVRRDTAWFAKLQGDPDLAKREQGHFESFVKSLRLE